MEPVTEKVNADLQRQSQTSTHVWVGMATSVPDSMLCYIAPWLNFLTTFNPGGVQHLCMTQQDQDHAAEGF
jgi:hypothetical protein